MFLGVFYRIEHLSLNMAMQLLVGVPLEMVHGALRIGLVYLCGVLAGECTLYTHSSLNQGNPFSACASLKTHTSNPKLFHMLFNF